jgi:hypothetical protein
MRILVILISGGDINPYIQNIYTLKEFMSTNYGDDHIDYASITSSEVSNGCDEILKFTYKYVNSKMQLSKICDFITTYKDKLKYDWFIKIRPEIQLLEKINITDLSTDYIHARAREYIGPRQILFGNSVHGEGEHQTLNSSYYSDTEDIVALDDQIYIFHRNIIENGGFSSLSSEELMNYYTKGNEFLPWHHEWTHSKCWKTRNIKLNVIGINMIFKRDGIFRKSGHINM